jgi:hypothetical protein
MRKNKFFNISDYRGSEFNQIERLINTKCKDFISNQSNWKLIESKNNNYKFIVDPHSFLKQLMASLLSLPWLRGNDLVDLTFKIDVKRKSIELTIISEDANNSIDSVLGYNHRKISLLHYFAKKKTYSNNIELVFNIICQITTEVIDKYEIERQNNNVITISNLKNNLPILVLNSSLNDFLKKVSSHIEPIIVSHMVTLIRHYEESVQVYESINFKLDSKNFFKEEQSEINHIIKIIPIYYSYIQFVEFSIINMLSHISDKNFVAFYQVYNEFEKLGFFISAGEKFLFETLQETNALLSDQINLTAQLIQRLASVESKLDYANFLNTMNTIKNLIRE